MSAKDIELKPTITSTMAPGAEVDGLIISVWSDLLNKKLVSEKNIDRMMFLDTDLTLTILEHKFSKNCENQNLLDNELLKQAINRNQECYRELITNKRRIVVFPVNDLIRRHWFLIVANLTKRKIIIYDSLAREQKNYKIFIDRINLFLENVDEYQETSFYRTCKTIEIDKKFPTQPNVTVDCGVYLMFGMKAVADAECNDWPKEIDSSIIRLRNEYLKQISEKKIQ